MASSSRGQPSSATGGRVEAPAGSVAAATAGEEGDSIRRLQNGPDVRGVALEGEKGRPVDLTPMAVEAIAESFGEWLREELQRQEGEEELRVSVGRDPRLSGPRLGAALFAGLARAGCSVFDMGLATTPACFMSTVLPRFNFDASIMRNDLTTVGSSFGSGSGAEALVRRPLFGGGDGDRFGGGDGDLFDGGDGDLFGRGDGLASGAPGESS